MGYSQMRSYRPEQFIKKIFLKLKRQKSETICKHTLNNQF